MDQATEEQIRERAHQLWEAAGKPEGRHEEFWQQAEREHRGHGETDSTINRNQLRRELYRSSNGDCWYLCREPGNGSAFIIHQPNSSSGGRASHIQLGEFLRSGKGPEQQAALRLIGTLVEVPPYA